MPTGLAQPQAGAAGLPCAAPPRPAAALCHVPGAPLRDTHHTWQFHRPHSKTPSSGGTRAPMRQQPDTTLLCPLPSGPLYPCRAPRPRPPYPQHLSFSSHPKSWPHWASLGPTLPSWLGQERGRPATALRGWGSSGSWAPSGACCMASMRLLMKKLFCRAETPCSGRMDVCRHTGQDSVRL